MSTNKKVKGAIFQMHKDYGEGIYYLAHGEGCTPAKEEAYVYSVKEARKLTARRFTPKEDGKWLLVYE